MDTPSDTPNEQRPAHTRARVHCAWVNRDSHLSICDVSVPGERTTADFPRRPIKPTRQIYRRDAGSPVSNFQIDRVSRAGRGTWFFRKSFSVSWTPNVVPWLWEKENAREAGRRKTVYCLLWRVKDDFGDCFSKEILRNSWDASWEVWRVCSWTRRVVLKLEVSCWVRWRVPAGSWVGKRRTWRENGKQFETRRRKNKSWRLLGKFEFRALDKFWKCRLTIVSTILEQFNILYLININQL